mmetsp:Transcript_17494/g.33162  ORF Transcript_17494/g.33162 Transcript_17494/m.33162 type:complete len:215 (-) Transcript_17494:246-890(-)
MLLIALTVLLISSNFHFLQFIKGYLMHAPDRTNGNCCIYLRHIGLFKSTSSPTIQHLKARRSYIYTLPASNTRFLIYKDKVTITESTRCFTITSKLHQFVTAPPPLCSIRGRSIDLALSCPCSWCRMFIFLPFKDFTFIQQSCIGICRILFPSTTIFLINFFLQKLHFFKYRGLYTVVFNITPYIRKGGSVLLSLPPYRPTMNLLKLHGFFILQ